MAEELKEPSNPFAQFITAPAEPQAESADKENPFSQFVAPPDVAKPDKAEASARPLSKLVTVTADGFPIFENPEDNAAMGNSVWQMLKTIPGGIARGMMDVPESIMQLGARGAEAVLPEGSSAKTFMAGQRKGFEQFQKEGEESYQKDWGGPTAAEPDIGRLIGNVAATAPISAVMPGGAAAGIVPRMVAGAATGAVSGALQPVTPDSNNFWGEKATQAGIGAAGGAVAPAIMGGVARTVSPHVNPDVSALMNAEVRPTLGQILGGSANRIEEAAQSVPLVGDAIKSARSRAVGDLNRAAINRALEPIGESLDKATPLGREAIAEMHEKIGANYDKLVPTLHVQSDPQFVGDLSKLISGAKMMPGETGQQFGKTLQDLVINKFSKTGHMTGETFKEMESELGRLGSDYTHSSIASERQLGGAFKQLQLNLRELLTRSNPDKAAELTAANSAFANALRVEGAAAKTGTEQGVFTPAQLLQSTRQLDPSLRKGAFARGDALMQDLADAGKSVLGNKVPDSGTPLRSMVMAGGALAPLYAFSPMAALGVGGGAGTLMGAYSKPGVNMLARLLASRPEGAAGAASLLRNPVTSTLPGILAAGGAGNAGP